MDWVLITNTNECKIYNYTKKPHELSLVKAIQHPENKLKDQDLVSDKPGHYEAGSHSRGAYTAPSDPKENKIDEFAREICLILNDGRVHQKYKNLIIIAPDKMHGHLSHHLDKNVANLIIKQVNKDLIFLKEKELLDYLVENTKFPNGSI